MHSDTKRACRTTAASDDYYYGDYHDYAGSGSRPEDLEEGDPIDRPCVDLAFDVFSDDAETVTLRAYKWEVLHPECVGGEGVPSEGTQNATAGGAGAHHPKGFVSLSSKTFVCA